jgi:hypothetical protein
MTLNDLASSFLVASLHITQHSLVISSAAPVKICGTAPAIGFNLDLCPQT